MPKNIVICSDGTGNTTIKGRGTNVFKLYEAVDTSLHPPNSSPRLPQITFYDDGIGTENLRLIRMLAGASGWGLGRNIRKLYGELARVYDHGDHIYLFGFSRGAFTVRMLARMIDTCGILDAKRNYYTRDNLADAVKAIYKNFLRPDAWTTPTIKKYTCDTRVKIEFIGVWDTVDAVGLPRVGDIINKVRRFKAIDCNLLGKVKHAYHALAIDDERAAFAPLLWDEKPEKNSTNDSSEQTVEQVWFAGSHSNVGGGYPRQGMSIVALDWMMAKAEKHGLRFIADQRNDYLRRCCAEDRLYDPRSGVWVFYRWKPRDIGQICERNNTRPRIHISVCERLALRPEGYAPVKLPENFEVVPTHECQKDIADKYTKMFKKEGPKEVVPTQTWREKTNNWIPLGSYVLFVGTILFAILELFSLVLSGVLSWGLKKDPTSNALAALMAGVSAIGKLLEFIHIHIFREWPVPRVLFFSFLISYVMVTFPKMLLDLRKDRFWHKMQTKLQRPLGLSSLDTESGLTPNDKTE